MYSPLTYILIGIALANLALMAFLLFVKPTTADTTADQDRGCIASAYQAERYGHDLQANLAECK